MKKFKNSLWIWCLVGILLLIANIMYAVIGDFSKSDILTLISGWVSGIATIFLGVIAFKQNKDYAIITNKRDNIVVLREEYNRFLDCTKNCSNFNFITEFVLELRWEEYPKEAYRELYYLRKCNTLLNIVVHMSNELDTFVFIPSVKKEAIFKSVELIDYINDKYYKLINYANYDKKLNSAIMEIIDDMAKWSDGFFEIKKRAKSQIEALIKNINACNDISKIQEIFDNVSKENEKVNEEIKLFRLEHNAKEIK